MLVVDISLNRGRIVSSIGAVRTNPKGRVDDDTLCTYEVGRIYKGKIPRPAGTIEHLYGDKAEVLAAKALALIAEHNVSATEEDNYDRLIHIVNDDTGKLYI